MSVHQEWERHARKTGSAKSFTRHICCGNGNHRGGVDFQFPGYHPCHLFPRQRWAYYFAVPFSLLLSVSAGRIPTGVRFGLYLLALVMLGSAIFGAYHAGVEWKWWAGPDTCSGDISGGLPDLSKPVVACNEAA